jgi:hypothetical protein
VRVAAVTLRQILERPASVHVPISKPSTHPGSGDYEAPSAVSSWPDVEAEVVQHQRSADDTVARYPLVGRRLQGPQVLADEAAAVSWLAINVLHVLNSVDVLEEAAGASEWFTGIPDINWHEQQHDQQPPAAAEANAAASADSCRASQQQQGTAASPAAAGSPASGSADVSDSEPPIKRVCIRLPDFSMIDQQQTANARVCIVGEAKRPAVMRHIGADLVSKWKQRDNTARQVVAQLYEYMQKYGTCYGAITCLAYTWLVRRHPQHPSRLQVCSLTCHCLVLPDNCNIVY